MLVDVLLEGKLEEFVADRLLAHCGHSRGTFYGGEGCEYVRKAAAGFSYRAGPDCAVLVLTDFMDAGTECVPQALHDYVLRERSYPPSCFLCRFAVNELESWLLADRKSLAAFLGIAEARITRFPDEVPDPKKELVRLAARSPRAGVRQGIVPEKGHKGAVARLYVQTMAGFVAEHWNIEAAAAASPSLARCVRRLCELG